MNYYNAKYMIACYFSGLSLYDRNVIDNLDITVDSICNSFDFDIKQEGLRFVKDLNIEKIRKTDLKTKPISDIIKRATPSVTLSIWITDSKFSKDNPPRLIINIHSSMKGLFESENKKANLFFIIGIREDVDYNYSFITSIINKSYSDNKGFFGGIFRNKSYLINNITSIEWAHKNFPIEIKKKGLSYWDPGFDEKL